MRGRTRNLCLNVLLLSACAASGCANVTDPLDLNTSDPAVDQRKIASLHSREAAYYRMKAQELAERIAVYERLFGPESEWVRGARLLEQFYEVSANEKDYQAYLHLNIAVGERPFPASRRGAPYINDGHSK